MPRTPATPATPVTQATPTTPATSSAPLAPPAAAGSAGAGERATVITTEGYQLRIRGGPGRDAPIVGMAPQGARSSFDPLLFVQRETRLIGTWYGSARPRIDFPRMLELTLAGKLKVEQLISRRYTLEQINEACSALQRGEIAGRAIVEF